MTSQAIYFYGPEGRGPCFIIGGIFFRAYSSLGDKSIVTWYHSYLVVVTTVPLIDSSLSPDLLSPPSPNFPNLPFGATNRLGTVLTIYDLKSKFIAYRSSFGQEVFDSRRGTDVGEGIAHVVPGNAELLVVTKTNKVLQLSTHS